MPNFERAHPAENQWELVVRYGHGLELGFHALWVETDDPDELPRRFRADVESRVECDLETLAGTYKGPPTQGIWIGPHAPGWTHLFAFGLYSDHPAIRNLGRRRIFGINFWGEVGEGLEPLHLHYDGELIGDVMPPYEEYGYMALPDYRPFTVGLRIDLDSGLEQDVHTLWCLVGRITGRFADREWWTSTRTFYRIPDRAWEDLLP